jgi:anti-sigma B factor antagonist
MSQDGDAQPQHSTTRFSVAGEVEGGITAIAVRGELDLGTASQLEASMAAASTPGLVIDLSACEFIDSTGIALLVNFFRDTDASGRRIVLCGLKKQVARVLEIASVDALIPTVATREEAIAALDG